MAFWILQRNLNWTFAHLLNGTHLDRMPKGIFCMAKNLTQVIESVDEKNRKEFYNVTNIKGKMYVVISAILFDISVVYFYLVAKITG